MKVKATAIYEVPEGVSKAKAIACIEDFLDGNAVKMEQHEEYPESIHVHAMMGPRSPKKEDNNG